MFILEPKHETMRIVFSVIDCPYLPSESKIGSRCFEILSNMNFVNKFENVTKNKRRGAPVVPNAQ